MTLLKKIIIAVILGIGLILFLLVPTFKEYETYASPDGTQTLTIYVQDNFRTISIGSSQQAYRLAYPVLRDAAGNRVSSWRSRYTCRFTIGERYVEWGAASVSANKFVHINRSTGKTNC